MTQIYQLLEEYGESHQHPTNKLIHWFCVPLIVWSLLAMIWFLKSPEVFSSFAFPLNWAVLLVAVSMVYYFLVSMSLAIGILVVFIIMMVIIYALESTGLPVWQVAVTIFILAWVGQFIGHSIEGERPSFLKDLQFLLIGPLWLLSFVYRKLEIAY